MSSLYSILWVFFLFAVHLGFADEKKKTDEEHAQSLLKWLNEEGGYFHPNLEMRRVDPSDPTSFFGMFVKDNIKENDILLRIPRSMVIDSREENPEKAALTCSTARNLAEQLRLKDESKYAPYVNYLLDTQPPGAIPSAWSDNAQSLFERVLGDSEGEFQVQEILGGDPFFWLDEWHESCNGSDDPLDEFSALLVIQRSWDDMLIPVMDMMSHRNGKWLNTVHSDVFDKSHEIELIAKRAIQKNEQIYTTYNMCENCGARKHRYGTPDILRDYGFVEQMPQSYFLYPFHFGFRLDYKDYDENGEPVGDVVVTEWINSAPEADDVEMFKGIVKQLKEKKNTILSVRDENVSDFEWNTIHAYADALEVAFEAAANCSIPVLVEPIQPDWYDEYLSGKNQEDDDDEDDEDDEKEEHDEL